MPTFMIRLILTLALLVFSTFLYADAFFNTPPKKDAPPSTVAPKAVLSPSDFQNKVNTFNQDTKNNTGQALSQELSKQPPPPIPDVSTPATTDSPPSPQPKATSTPTVTPSAPPAEVSPPPASVTSPPSQPVLTPPPQPVTPPPAASVKQPQPYTGFGTGDGSTGKTAAPNNSNQTNGWNIKY